jgi:hypothetical protein
MSKQKAIIDCAKKLVKLTTEDGQEIEYIPEPLITHKGATNQIKLNWLEAKQNHDVQLWMSIQTFFQKSCQVCHQIMTLNSSIEFYLVRPLYARAPIGCLHRS